MWVSEAARLQNRRIYWIPMVLRVILELHGVLGGVIAFVSWAYH